MSGRIFLLQGSGDLVGMQETAYDSEDLLQTLIERYPDLLAGDQMRGGSPRRWLLIQREASIPDSAQSGGRWALDHLFVDDDGVPTLVEVKRSTDTRIRREVVGQLLDYAANALEYWPVEHIRSTFELDGAGSAGRTATLDEFLRGMDPQEFWQSVKTNLQAGRVRLVFLADRIPRELRRIIEFLNGQMDPAEVIGIEVTQYVGSHQGTELKTLVPKLVGQTAEAESKKSAGGTGPIVNWTRTEFEQEIASSAGNQAAANLRQVLDWADEHAPGTWLGRKPGGGAHIVASDVRPMQNFCSIWPHGELNFWYLYSGRWPPFDDDQKLGQLLEHVQQWKPDIEMLPKRGPRIYLGQMNGPSDVKRLIGILEWILTQLQQTEST